MSENCLGDVVLGILKMDDHDPDLGLLAEMAIKSNSERAVKKVLFRVLCEKNPRRYFVKSLIKKYVDLTGCVDCIPIRPDYIPHWMETALRQHSLDSNQTLFSHLSLSTNNSLRDNSRSRHDFLSGALRTTWRRFLDVEKKRGNVTEEIDIIRQQELFDVTNLDDVSRDLKET